MGGMEGTFRAIPVGPEAENIFKTFALPADDQKKFDTVLGKYDGYFCPRRNVLHERICFHQRVQRPGEKVEMFIRALYDLSEHCNFGAARDENIRDRIIVGILDKELSRKLQLEADPTLALTIQTVRQSEEVTAQVNRQQAEACPLPSCAGGCTGTGKILIQRKTTLEK